MPELPEVEVTRQGLLPHVPGHAVMAVWCGKLPLRRPLSRAALERHVRGQVVEAVARRAKYLLLHLTSGARLLLHLGMSGRLRLDPAEAPRQRHDHLELVLDSGLTLRLNDARRFGLVEVWPPTRAAALAAAFEADLGPEPLEPGFDGKLLRHHAGNSRRPIKELLLDSRVVVGVGNIYASESLFQAGIHPATPGTELAPAQWRALGRAVPRVLRAAIAAGGTTISDFLQVGGESGYFQLELAVYGRSGQPCRTCGQPIHKIIQGGRSTFFCPHCQRG
ncbi:MAG: DNA-formamidopyrimidine glycosylase [Desulfobulbaceae bacterium A2]|nr:MAG: DNA-formamidopyrimidine glycosylase [Desulfobulbaceae bacterium A2]